ncbi:hypothetical protein, partial [Bradyrhizobium sp. 168]|uniref:hypothetical protein n=1 Tax=Bradyrhizobium sp. 168 TaxID=2782639 RepID=UPI001FFB1FEA
NPHTSSHGPSGAELTRLPLNAPTSNQKSNCNANFRGCLLLLQRMDSPWLQTGLGLRMTGHPIAAGALSHDRHCRYLPLTPGPGKRGILDANQ